MRRMPPPVKCSMTRRGMTANAVFGLSNSPFYRVYCSMFGTTAGDYCTRRPLYPFPNDAPSTSSYARAVASPTAFAWRRSVASRAVSACATDRPNGVIR